MTHTHVKNRYQRSDGSNIEWNQTDGRTRPIAVLTGAAGAGVGGRRVR